MITCNQRAASGGRCIVPNPLCIFADDAHLILASEWFCDAPFPLLDVLDEGSSSVNDGNLVALSTPALSPDATPAGPKRTQHPRRRSPKLPHTLFRRI